MSGYITFNPCLPMLLRQQVDPPIGKRGRISSGWGTHIERQTLPSDYLYMTQLIVKNTISGSVILVTSIDGTEIARGVSSGSDVQINVPFYGSNQTVKVVIRKSTSSPFYQSYETQAVITSEGTTLYVSQVSDEN